MTWGAINSICYRGSRWLSSSLENKENFNFALLPSSVALDLVSGSHQQKVPSPHTPPVPPTPCEQPPPLSIPHQTGTLEIADEPILTHHRHPKRTVYIRVHSWRVFCGFRQMFHDMDPPPQDSSTALKSLCALFTHLSLPPVPGSYWSFTVSRVSPFPGGPVVGILQTVIFSDWLLSPHNMHLVSPPHHDFSWLDSSFQ